MANSKNAAVADSSPSSRHTWHYYLFFFSLLVGAAGTLSFVLGRIVNIVATTSFNHRTFEEVPIFGDLTERDMETYLDIEPVTNSTVRYFLQHDSQILMPRVTLT